MGEKVRLTPMFEWTCFDCGRNSTLRVPPIDDLYSAEEIIEFYEEMGLDEQDRHGIDLRPFEVTCDHCGITFEVDDEQTEYDDSDSA